MPTEQHEPKRFQLRPRDMIWLALSLGIGIALDHMILGLAIGWSLTVAMASQRRRHGSGKQPPTPPGRRTKRPAE